MVSREHKFVSKTGSQPVQSSALRVRSWRWLTLALAAIGALVWLACNGDAGIALASGAENEVVAKVGSESVSRETLLDRSSNQLDGVELERVQCVANTEKKRHDVLEANLEAIVREQLAELGAADSGLSGDEWFQKERTARAAAVDQAQVDALIDNNPRLRQADRQQIEPQVRNYLAEEALVTELKERFPVDYQLEPYRVEVAAEGPAKGADEGAPVTIVEFSDFQCPYCKRVVPALDQAVEHYGDKVRLVFRQFPLHSIHPQAQKAAEASLCAEDQDKFWEMHDRMFENQRQLAISDLKQAAADLELDQKKFDQCLDSGKYADQVTADLRAGAKIGVSGTPALFINGRPMSGAVSFEALSQVIDEELGSGK